MKITNPLIIVGFVLLGIVLIVAVIKLPNLLNTPKVTGIAPKVINEGKSTYVSINGKNLPDKGKLEVLLSDKPVKIISATKEKMVVLVNIARPSSGSVIDAFPVNFKINNDGKSIYSGTIMCMPDNEVKVTSFTPANFYRTNTVTFNGKNLSKENVTVMVNNQECKVISYNANQLTVQLTAMPISPSIRVTVWANGKVVYNSTARNQPFRIPDINWIREHRIINLKDT